MSKWNKQELENMLEDVVNELDLSDLMIEKHGQEGTAPAKLVRLVLEHKDREISMLKMEMRAFVQTLTAEIKKLISNAWDNGMGSYHNCKTSKALDVERESYIDDIEDEIKALTQQENQQGQKELLKGFIKFCTQSEWTLSHNGEYWFQVECENKTTEQLYDAYIQDQLFVSED